MKGLFYSLMMALFVIPILALVFFYSQTTIPQNIATSIRVDELQYFSESLEEDLSRFVQINGKRALIAATSLIISGANSTGLDNASLRLAEVVENGTLYGSRNLTFEDQKNLTEWVKNISDIASRSGFNINLTVLSFDVIQNDSFSVLFKTTVYINISDATTGMGILKNISVAEVISLENMSIQDPLYLIKTNGTVFRNLKKSPFIPFNKIDSTNLSNLTSDIINRYYHNSAIGASFLDRLEGKVNLSERYQPHGLESFIFIPDFLSYDSSLSVLDYQYWNNKHGYFLNNSLKSSDPIYNWFRIDVNNSYVYDSLLNTTT